MYRSGRSKYTLDSLDPKKKKKKNYKSSYNTCKNVKKKIILHYTFYIFPDFSLDNGDNFTLMDRMYLYPIFVSSN